MSSGPRSLAATLAALLCCGAACSFDFARSWQDGAADAASADRTYREPPGPIPDAGPTDAGPPADAPVDLAAPPADTQPPGPPQLCWAGSLGGTAVGCPAGRTAIAGGAECPTGIGASTAQPGGSGWRSACAGGAAPGFTEAICATGSWKRVEQSAAGDEVSAACGGTDVAVGGGCACAGGGTLRVHRPASSPEGWTCRCESPGVTVEAICTSPAVAALLGRRTADRTWSDEALAAVNCPAGTNALSGGCSSPATLITDGGLVDPAGWLCRFDSPATSATAYAICVTDPLDKCP